MIWLRGIILPEKNMRCLKGQWDGELKMLVFGGFTTTTAIEGKRVLSGGKYRQSTAIGPMYNLALWDDEI